MLAGANTHIVLVGNKNDLAKRREVSYEEAAFFADNNGPPSCAVA